MVPESEQHDYSGTGSPRWRASCAAAASSSLAIGGAQLVLLRGAVGEQACCHLPAVTTA